MAAGMTPMQLVVLLNDVFLCFDGLVERYDLEKIKTIGDCYMVAAGVPRRRADHAHALVAWRSTCRQPSRAHRSAAARLAFRIGINSGPVVAGVIGRKKFIYDLWGEVVNLASRMEMPRPARHHPDHRTHLAPGEGRLRLREARHDRRQRRRPDPRVACHGTAPPLFRGSAPLQWRVFIAVEHCPKAIDEVRRPDRP